MLVVKKMGGEDIIIIIKWQIGKVDIIERSIVQLNLNFYGGIL